MTNPKNLENELKQFLNETAETESTTEEETLFMN